MTKPLTQTALGAALGLSPSSVTALKRRGMPTHSIAAAHAWREANVRPRIDDGPVRGAPTALAELESLWPIARAALAAGRLELLRPALQAALRAVPPQARSAALLDPEVMDALCAPLLAALESPGPGQRANAQPLSETDAEVMGCVWYCVAAGESFPLAWLEEPSSLAREG